MPENRLLPFERKDLQETGIQNGFRFNAKSSSGNPWMEKNMLTKRMKKQPVSLRIWAACY